MSKENVEMGGGDLYDLLLNRLVETKDSRKKKPRYVTIDGDEILCHSKEDAVALADFLEEVCGFPIHVGFYNPQDDEANDEVDFCTGKWCVYAD